MNPDISYLIPHHSHLNPLPIRMDPANPPSLRHRLLTGLAVLVALPVLYLVSFGPFCYVFARTDTKEESFLVIYFPLRSLADRSPTTRRWFFNYANWCFALGERHRDKAEKTPSEEP